MCSGMNHLDNGTVEKCKEICTKRRPYGPTLGVNMKAAITIIVILKDVTMAQMKNEA